MKDKKIRRKLTFFRAVKLGRLQGTISGLEFTNPEGNKSPKNAKHCQEQTETEK